MTAIPILRRLRQKGHEVEASLDHMVDHAKNKQTKKNVFMNSIVIFCVLFETTVKREAILKIRANLEEDIHALPKAFLL